VRALRSSGATGHDRKPPIGPSLEAAPSVAGREMALSNLPERNPFFTGREDVLTRVQEALAIQGRAALSGLGGIGKTQTAVEYAHRRSDEYDYILWITAHSREALVSGYVMGAGLLNLPEAATQDQTVAVNAVKGWLSSNQRWLLILDNADDLKMVREFIPHEKNGHVLLTTRARATGAVARFVEIQEMGTKEGALFLLRRGKYIAEDAPLDAAVEADQGEAKEIAAQLDGLPLALDQAAAYIEETVCGLLGYLSLYRTHGPELLRRRGALISDHAADHPDPVATTWVLSFENIEKANPAAAELLHFCAFLSPDGIPEEVFSKGAPELGPVLGVVASDELALDRALSEILKYSLLHRDPKARTLEIHRLVQAVLKQGMDEATQRSWAERAVRSVDRAFPFGDFSTWTLCERLVAQARACAQLIDEWRFEFPEARRLLDVTGTYLSDRWRLTAAEPLLKRALAIIGPEHPDVAWTLLSLGVLYDRQGRYEAAEPFFVQALAIQEKALGPDHSDLAWGLYDLAVLYDRQGRYEASESLFVRALALQEKARGPEHLDVVLPLQGLAVLYDRQGRHAEAKPLFNRALTIRERALGPDNPDVAWSLQTLALSYHNQGRYAEAEPLFERALAIRERTLGLNHPDVARSLDNLAVLYYNQGRHAEAEAFHKRALSIREQALGPDHPDVATSLENFAFLLRAMGRREEAEPLEARAQAIRASCQSQGP
jgi:tetratricopeptide (TPR) repeat protein